MLTTPSNNQSVGREGEVLACKFLKKNGYSIIEQNFKKRHGDIDIVALDGETLVFVEVKARRTRTYGQAVEAITPWKVRALIQSAHFYKLQHPQFPEAMRIDVVAIDYTEKSPRIELIKNITM